MQKAEVDDSRREEEREESERELDPAYLNGRRWARDTKAERGLAWSPHDVTA